RPSFADIVVIGGGIIGCATAAILADRGAIVVLVEATAIAAGASGRNLGAVQHPFDPVLAPLYRESLTRHRALAAEHGGFRIDRDPPGLLLLNRDAAAAAVQARRLAHLVPQLHPELVSPDDLTRLEPSLAHGPTAVLLRTGHPIPPGSATGAWADVAASRGVRFVIGSPARPVVESDRIVGAQLADGYSIAADTLLVAAGPWTPSVVDPSGRWQPIRLTWGVTVQLRLPGLAPRHILEEDEVDTVNRAAGATARAAEAIDYGEPEPPSLFSLASAAGVSTLGSTFLPMEPDPAFIEPLLLHRAAEFLPAVERAEIIGRRACARPQSVDGLPFIGRAPGVDGLFVCAGHGPWGISTGPATAAMVARAILDATEPPAELDARRQLPVPAIG
ncbi:MAG: FAD-binding oxidoreductase, partial [Chloroflexi bacterium]|nr:FAD-binding oxidoreductase [Chloroflexota bacterium]